MRQMISGWVASTFAGAALAVTMGVAPVSACEVVNPCGHNYAAGVGYGVQYEGYATERLPDPQGPQYYYVNHGPTYTGPGNIAPDPVYQENTVIGAQPYYYHRRYHGYRGYYHGGPYANPLNHHYYGARVRGPVVYTYPRVNHFRPYRAAPYYGSRYGVRHGYAPRFYGPRPMAHGPRMHNTPMYATPRGPMPRNSHPGAVPMPAPNPKPQI